MHLYTLPFVGLCTLHTRLPVRSIVKVLKRVRILQLLMLILGLHVFRKTYFYKNYSILTHIQESITCHINKKY